MGILYEENDSIYSISYSLEEKPYEFPAQVCERNKTTIMWSDSDWGGYKTSYKNFSIKKDNYFLNH